MAKPTRVPLALGPILIAGAVCALGCGTPEKPVQTTDAVSTADADADTDAGVNAEGARLPDAATDSEACPDAPGCDVCTPVALDGALPIDMEVDTRGKGSALEARCGGADAPELALRFTAPASGTFSFSTEGSRFNTVLYALSEDCAGDELACNDDRVGLDSVLELDLEAGQRIVLVVDGFEGQAGRARLRVSALERSSCCEGGLAKGCGSAAVEACVCEQDDFCCTTAWDEVCAEYAAHDCGACEGGGGACEVAATFDAGESVLGADLDGTSDAALASCGNAGAPDVLFGFTAEVAGTYTFATRGSGVSDTVLAVLDGAGCGGTELGCNDDDGSELDSRVSVELAAGQSVTLVAESWDDEPGEISLTVNTGDEPEPAASCAPAALPVELPLLMSGEVDSGAGTVEPSCALFGSRGEVVYAFVADQDGSYRFDTRGSEADTILQILDGDCAGPELGCNDDPEGGELAAQLEVPLVAGQRVMVVVDSYDGLGSYVLGVARADSAQEGADCCAAHGESGCADAAVEACVCAADAACCAGAWDALCASAVQAQACGGCSAAAP